MNPYSKLIFEKQLKEGKDSLANSNFINDMNVQKEANINSLKIAAITSNTTHDGQLNRGSIDFESKLPLIKNVRLLTKEKNNNELKSNLNFNNLLKSKAGMKITSVPEANIFDSEVFVKKEENRQEAFSKEQHEESQLMVNNPVMNMSNTSINNDLIDDINKNFKINDIEEILDMNLNNEELILEDNQLQGNENMNNEKDNVQMAVYNNGGNSTEVNDIKDHNLNRTNFFKSNTIKSFKRSHSNIFSNSKPIEKILGSSENNFRYSGFTIKMNRIYNNSLKMSNSELMTPSNKNAETRFKKSYIRELEELDKKLEIKDTFFGLVPESNIYSLTKRKKKKIGFESFNVPNLKDITSHKRSSSDLVTLGSSSTASEVVSTNSYNNRLMHSLKVSNRLNMNKQISIAPTCFSFNESEPDKEDYNNFDKICKKEYLKIKEIIFCNTMKSNFSFSKLPKISNLINQPKLKNPQQQKNGSKHMGEKFNPFNFVTYKAPAHRNSNGGVFQY